MVLQSLITVGLMAAATALGASLPGVYVKKDNFGCDVQGTDEDRAIHQQFAIAEAKAGKSGKREIPNIVVDTYMHIITASNNGTHGFISEDVVMKQLAVLNDGYKGAGISFALKDVNRKLNSTWANEIDLPTMRRTLRQGTYADLNLYFVPNMTVFGYCTLPLVAEKGTSAFFEDGCTVRSDTVPGGDARNYNLGKTAVHEVGHWFGLLHTFEGGCTGHGDMISDTPAQKSPTTGCPVERDSCPSELGLDPIHNYMDYSYDSCYDEFTTGQMDRMSSFWNKYRTGTK